MDTLRRGYASAKSAVSSVLKTRTSTLVIYGLIALLVIGLLYRLLGGGQVRSGYQMGGGQQQAGHPAGPIRVVLYYLPKCPHCIAMLPEWQKFASLHEHDADLKVHAVNAEADPAAAARANVQAFPTVVLYRYNGQKLFFNGDRTAAALERWVNHHQIERQE